MSRCCLLLAFLAGAHGFSLLSASRPSLADANKRVSAQPRALDLPAASNLLAAQIMGLDTNPYGGVSAFSQTQTGEAGDLNIVVLLGVVFPTVLTLYFYKDNVAAIFEPPPEVEPPKGWRKVPSRSRPGKFSYENIKTKERYDRIPNWAWKEE